MLCQTVFVTSGTFPGLRFTVTDKKCSRKPFGTCITRATATQPSTSVSTTPLTEDKVEHVEKSQKSSTFDSPSKPPFPKYAIPYFAYFANMNPRKIGPLSVLAARRFNIERSEPAVLNSYRVVFTTPGVPLEPAVANLERSPSSTVHGIVHWLKPGDFDRLARSEGVPPPGFPLPPFGKSLITRIETVDVIINGTVVKARTFIFPSLAPSWAKPSKRYVMVARDGARYWNLDKDYVENVLDKIQYDTGPLGGFGLYTEPRPHMLDRPNETERFGRVESEIYSPYSRIRAEEAMKVFEEAEKNFRSNQIRLVQVTKEGIGKKPLYFIPGIEGSGRGILSQIYDIEQEGVYIVKSFVYPYQSRESLESIVSRILEMIAHDADGAPATIVSESMGGVLSILVGIENALRKDHGIKKPTVEIDLLMMINPATAYVQSEPRELWDFLFWLGLSDDAYKALLPIVLLPFLLDFGSTRTGITPELAPRLVKILRSLNRIPDVLPKDAMEHRLKLLSRLKIEDDDMRPLNGSNGPKDIALICSLNDNLIPSFAESYRLRRIVPGILTAVIPFGGHSPMFDRRFSLSFLLRPFAYPRKKETVLTKQEPSKALIRRQDAMRKKLGIAGYTKKKPKSRVEMRQLRDFTKQMIQDYSPVFIGEENISQLEENKPVLFVSNHTLLGWLDGALTILRIWDQRSILLTALSHPALFQVGLTAFDLGSSLRASPQDLRNFDLLESSPISLLESLARGHWTLLFPGGARDALKQSEAEKHTVTWPEDPEFVRSCALFGATIVPMSVAGNEDSVQIIAGSDVTKQIVDGVSRLSGRQMDWDMLKDNARDWKGSEGKDLVIPPVMIPKEKTRVYIRFGKPIQVPEECLQDKNLAKSIYENARQNVADGLQIILRRREKDEYRQLERRKQFRRRYGDDVPPPAGLGWTWMRGEDSYLDDELQPPLN